MRLKHNSAGLLMAVVALLGGCATKLPTSCSGLGPVTFAVTYTADGTRIATPVYPEGEDRIARLTCEADRGDQAAARELALMYEKGINVPRDEVRAAALYGRAAATMAAVTQVYAPPVRLGGSGSVMILPNPGATRGDPEAQYRLARMYLDGRGVSVDPDRARSLLTQAAGQNHAAAGKMLLRLSAPR